MGILGRIKRFIEMIINFFMESAEDRIPPERWLAGDRQKKAGQFRKMMDSATDVGEAANLMAEELAESKIVAANIKENAVRHLQVAKEAQLRGDKATEEREHAAAAALADDWQEAEADVRELEQIVADAYRDQEDAEQLVLHHAEQLERLARSDALLVSRLRMSEMKEESLKLREALLQLVPEGYDDMRAKIVMRAKKREARVKSRARIVDALWQQKKRKMIDQRTQVSARGAEVLRQLEGQVGYQPTKAMPTPAEDDPELKALVAGEK